MDINFKKDLGAAFKIVWMIYSVLFLLLILITLLSPETLLKVSPVCISKSLYGEECFMCGMTRAFTKISEGNFPEAAQLNKFSVFLFSAMILNSFFFLIFITGRFYSKLKSKMPDTKFLSKKLFQN